MRRELLHYMIENDNAKDTFEGILKWWFPKGGFEWGEEIIKDCLDFLVLQGWLAVRDGVVPSYKIFGVNKERLKEMKAFLI